MSDHKRSFSTKNDWYQRRSYSIVLGEKETNAEWVEAEEVLPNGGIKEKMDRGGRQEKKKHNGKTDT